MIKKEENDVEKVFNYIQDKLTSEHYSYEERITPELIIKEKLKVSRSVVRESMNNFSVLGILERTQGSGTYPTNKNSEEYIKELLEIKETFDLILMHKAVERNKEKLLATLEERLEDIEKEETSYYEVISYYDKKIAGSSENNIMINFYEYIYKFVDKILKKKIESQSKKEVFESHKSKYIEISKSI